MEQVLAVNNSNNNNGVHSDETNYQNLIGRLNEENGDFQSESKELVIFSLKTTDAERLSKFHSDKLKECQAKGQAHGKRLMPPIEETEIEPFEKRTIADYQAQVANLSAHGNGILAAVYSDVVHISEQLNEKEQIQNQIEKTVSDAKVEKERALEQEREKHATKVKRIHDRPDWKNAVTEFEEAKVGYDEERKETGNVLPDSVSHWWYVPFLLGIGAAELPLNYQVFKSFGDVPILTLIMALTLVIAIPFSAHGSGKFLKQIKEHSIVYPILFIVSILLIVTISFVTAQLRADFLATKGVQITKLEVSIFFLIGILLFFAGLIASYFVHSESEKVVKAKSRFALAEDNFSKRKTEVDSALDEESTRHEKRVDEINQEFLRKEKEVLEKIKNLENNLHVRVGNFNGMLCNLKGLEKAINQNCKSAIQKYREENALYRDDHSQPLAWKKDLPDLVLYFQQTEELVETFSYPQKSFAAGLSL